MAAFQRSRLLGDGQAPRSSTASRRPIGGSPPASYTGNTGIPGGGGGGAGGCGGTAIAITRGSSGGRSHAPIAVARTNAAMKSARVRRRRVELAFTRLVDVHGRRRAALLRRALRRG